MPGTYRIHVLGFIVNHVSGIGDILYEFWNADADKTMRSKPMKTTYQRRTL